MELVEDKKRGWFTEHVEGMFVWGVELLLLAVSMYIAIRY
jgi:hypothetical protein